MTTLHTQVYSRCGDNLFTEGDSVYHDIRLGIFPARYDIRTVHHNEPITEIRVDPSDRPVSFILQEVSIISEDGEVLVHWRTAVAKQGLPRGVASSDVTLADAGSELICECVGDDANLTFELPSDRPAHSVVVRLIAAQIPVSELPDQSPSVSADIVRAQAALSEAVRLSQAEVRKSLDELLLEQGALLQDVVQDRASQNAVASQVDGRLAAIIKTMGELGARLDRFEAALGHASEQLKQSVKHATAPIEPLLQSLQSELSHKLAEGAAATSANLKAIAPEVLAHVEVALARTEAVAEDAAAKSISLLTEFKAELDEVSAQLDTHSDAIESGLKGVHERLPGLASRIEGHVDRAAGQIQGDFNTTVTGFQGRVDRHFEVQRREAEDRSALDRRFVDLHLERMRDGLVELLGSLRADFDGAIEDMRQRDVAAALPAEIANLTAAQARQVELIGGLRADFHVALEEVRQRDVAAALSAEIAILGATQARQVELIAGLRSDYHVALEEVRQRDVAAAQSLEIAKLEAAQARQVETEQNLRSQLDHATSLARRLEDEVFRLRMAVDAANNHAQAIQHTLHAIVASSSWRMTRPVRVLKRFLTTGRLRATRPQPTRPAVDGGESDEPGSSWSAGPIPAKSFDFDAGAPVARLIAFYLPQFHPIPENDLWWGSGFTEWTNVRKARPQFAGHYQPRIPGDLGYYDLRERGVQEIQVAMAKSYGLGGFCFYFYWFAGKTLLEMPVRSFAENPNIDFPFCLCWANENWSRRWDGLDQEVLIAQEHSAADDLAFISHLADYLRHPGYIRVDGRPLLVVYRPSLLPNAAETAERWRTWCREAGLGEIHLAYTQSFESTDPGRYGFDSAIEFPPNNTDPPVITETVDPAGSSFKGTVYDYRVYPERSEHYAAPSYPLYRGVFPMWDNEARRTGRGTVFHHASPSLYRRWLRNAVVDTVRRFRSPEQRLVFINAWNEWAEGAYLEPDGRYGNAYLEATAAALDDVRAPVAQRLVLVSHDAYPHGAQFLALNIARVLAGDLGYELEIVILGDGPMKQDFARYGKVHDLTGVDPLGVAALELAEQFRRQGAIGAICNTTVSGLFLKTLKGAGLDCIALVHEMEGVVRDNGLVDHAAAIVALASQIVFPSKIVLESFSKVAKVKTDNTVIRVQGLYKLNGARTEAARGLARLRLRQHFGLSLDAEIVLGVGYADLRKGVDLFVEAGAKVMAARPKAIFIWVGAIDPTLGEVLQQRIANSTVAHRFHFVGFQSVTDDFYAGADIFALTSREDPFPTVVMEALDVGVPVVAFTSAGGFVDLLSRGCGVLVDPIDAGLLASAVIDLLGDDIRRTALGRAGKHVVDADFAFRRYVMDLVHLLDPQRLKVSVVVPNFNYARFLEARLTSVDQQTVAPYEIVFLDDASSDASLDIAQNVLATLKTPTRVAANEVNSGSVFRQWLKGVELSTGDLIWIAEADDLTAPEFLREVTAAFSDPDVVLSFCQSKQMGPDGGILADDYLDYVRDVDPDRWTRAYVSDGAAEARLALAIKNTIPNVSAVVFRREALLAILRENIDEIATYRVAGDWMTYVRLLESGKIAFSPQPLNLHRRHASSVTIGAFDAGQLREILRMQQFVRHRFDLPETVSHRARDYADELYKRFGLGNEVHGSLVEDPNFAQFA